MLIRRIYRTTPSRRRQLMRFLGWLGLAMLLLLMVLGTASMISQLHRADGDLITVFVQGMARGMLFCRGAQP